MKNSLNDAQTTREMEQLGQTKTIMAGEYCLPGMDVRYKTAFFDGHRELLKLRKPRWDGVDGNNQ